MKYIILAHVLLLSACGGSGSSNNDGSAGQNPNENVIPRDKVEGVWRIDETFSAACIEIYSFGNSNNLSIISGNEFVRASYSVLEDPVGRNQLDFSVDFDLGGADCEGDTIDTTGQSFGPFFIEHVQDSMLWFDQAEGGEELARFEYFPQQLNSTGDVQNSVTIDSITPDEAPVGLSENFLVSISYTTEQDVRLVAGFNETERDSFTVIWDQEIDADSSGELIADVLGSPYDWGEGNQFVFKVLMLPNSGGDGPTASVASDFIPIALIR